MDIRIKKEIAGYKPNTIVSVDEKDVSSRLYWNRRLKDAIFDDCCEVVKKTKQEVKENENVVQSKYKSKKNEEN